MDSGLHHWAGTSNLLPQSSGEMLGSSQDSPAAPGWYGNIPNTPARGLSHATPSSLSLPAGITDQQSRGTHSGFAPPPPAPPAPVTTAQPSPSALLRCIRNKGCVPWRSQSSPLPLQTLRGHFPGFCLPRAGESAARLPSPAPCQGTYLGRLHFVAATAAPAREVGQHLALLPVEARLHLAPPLLQHDGGWGRGGRQRPGCGTGCGGCQPCLPSGGGRRRSPSLQHSPRLQRPCRGPARHPPGLAPNRFSLATPGKKPKDSPVLAPRESGENTVVQ